jgi:hypothetical protein
MNNSNLENGFSEKIQNVKYLTVHSKTSKKKQ